MNGSAHDFVTVDMRGLKAALVARARTERVSVSLVVRRAVERELGAVQGGESGELPPAGMAATVKLSVRVTALEAERLAAAALHAGLSRGAFIVGLFDAVPSLSKGPESRRDSLAALTTSNSELAALSRNLHRLAELLRGGDVRAAQAYRRLLDCLGEDVRAHLRLAAAALADLQPARRSHALADAARRA